MAEVHACRPVELIFVDPSRLLRLSRDRGRRGAEAITGVAVEEIITRVTSVDAAWRAGEVSRLAKVARSLVGVAREIGLETLADVAGKVAEVAARGDATALAALVARLVRVADASVSAVGNLDHLSL